MSNKRRDYSRHLKQLCVFSMFGVIMYVSKQIMESLPNFHLLGMFIVSLTVIYRKKALIPIYVYVFLDGLFHGFNLWWYPYLYIWTVLWGFAMLLPKNMPDKIGAIVYPLTAALHGILFGVLYSPFQALAYGFNFSQYIQWIVVGFGFDIMHAVGNFLIGFLIIPCIKILKMLEKTY